MTPIGAKGQTTGSVAAAVVDYLEGDRSDPGVALLAAKAQAVTGGASTGDYYADSPEGPGRWLGAGAVFRQLDGTVDRQAFTRVLEGRDPHTGARLVTAQGSSQRGHLAVGTAAAFDTDGRPMYSVADAASLLGVRRGEMQHLVDAANNVGNLDARDAGWIASIEHPSHGILIGDSEISRLQELAAAPVDVQAIRDAGASDDELSVNEAARLLQVASSYVRRLCRAGQQLLADRPRAHLAATVHGEGGTKRFLIRREQLAGFASGRKPPTARVGFDLTLTVEKSLGVVTMLSAGGRQQAMVRALRVANETAIAHLDQVASVGRRTGEVVSSEGLLVASYFHGTSRALDPHPHHHNVVANAIVDDQGDVRTLDARALYRHAPAAAALATAAARWEMRDLGVDWWLRDDGVWEMSGVSRDMIREFSQRRGEMDEVRQALEEKLGRTITHEEENTVAKSTRAPKTAVDPISLQKQWLTRADRVGFDVDDCFDRVTRSVVLDQVDDDTRSGLFSQLVDPDSGLCAESNTFSRSDVFKAIADWSLPGTDDDPACRKVIVPPAEIERLTAEFCATTLVAEIDRAGGGVIRRRDGSVVADGQNEPAFTTIELLDVQQDLLDVIDAGINTNAGTVTAEHLDAALASDPRLSGEQRSLVTGWLTSGDRVQTAVGRAGTGKTTTMKAATVGWQSAGYRVIGAAIKGEAAQQLATDAGIESETVAMLLARHTAGIRVFDARTVVIVDEASTIGDRDLHTLVHAAIDAGAVVRLIGDPAQHSSVPAGGSYTSIVERYPERTPELTEVRRLTNAGERDRAELLRSGSVGVALDQLVASGQLTLTDSDADTYAHIVERWATERAAGRAHPMVHGRNDQRRLLNTLAQQLRLSNGDIDPTVAVALADGRRLCVGDEVIARHGNRRLFPDRNRDAWMRNGTLGTVTAVHTNPDKPAGDRVDIHTAGGIITIPRADFDRAAGGVDLAYAVTSYAVQGSTREVSTSALTATTSRAELYVDITRGRNSNKVYATRNVTGGAAAAEPHLPALPVDVVDSVAGRMARDAEPTAVTQASGARSVEHRRTGRSLAGLYAAKRRSDSPDALLDAAIQRSERGVHRVGANRPDPALVRLLPRPVIPHLANRWDQIAGDIAVHHATLPGPLDADRGLASVVAPDAAEMSNQLTTLAVDVTRRRLVDHLDPASPTANVVRTQPGWLDHHLAQRTATGTVAAVDLDQLAGLVDDVHTWRAENDLIDNTADDQPLGPSLDNDIGRTQQRALARRLTTRSAQSRDSRSIA